MSRLGLALLLAALAVPCAGEVYKWTDDDGKVHYSDEPPPDAETDQPDEEAQVLELEEDEDEADEASADRGDGSAATGQGGIGIATGWAISPRRVVTNHHVVEGADTVEIVLGESQRVPARVAATDANHDLALLRFSDDRTRLKPIPVQTAPAPSGSQVLTIGYPHIDVMGSEPKVTTGLINATSGVRDDERLYQISTPIQQGNSGGPLFNKQGQVVGVVVGKLNAAAVARASGDLPQNVNYAVKSQFLARWLDGGNVAPEQGDTVAPRELVKQVRDSVVMVVVR